MASHNRTPKSFLEAPKSHPVLFHNSTVLGQYWRVEPRRGKKVKRHRGNVFFGVMDDGDDE